MLKEPKLTVLSSGKIITRPPKDFIVILHQAILEKQISGPNIFMAGSPG
jgi:hypothetical protein